MVSCGVLLVHWKEPSASPARGAPATIGAAAPNPAWRTIGPPSDAGGFLDGRRVRNLGVEPGRTWRLGLCAGRQDRCCKRKRYRGQSDRELLHKTLLRSAVKAKPIGPDRSNKAARRAPLNVALAGEDGLGLFGSQQRIDVEMFRQARSQLLDRIGLLEHR